MLPTYVSVDTNDLFTSRDVSRSSALAALNAGQTDYNNTPETEHISSVRHRNLVTHRLIQYNLQKLMPVHYLGNFEI